MVENYPAVPHTSGAALGERMKEQAEQLGANIAFGIVEAIVDKTDSKEIVLQDGSRIESRAVICATGATPRQLGVEGEGAFLGRNVSYCAVCDGAFLANKDVFVIGGGDTAVEDAIYLSAICKSVTLVHRRDTFRAPKTRVEVLRTRPNVTIQCHTTLEAITGEERVTGVVLKAQNGLHHYRADGVFIAVGTVPATDYLKALPLVMENGYVVAEETGATNVKGIFVAGDIRKKQLRQVVTAVADGANAATSAIHFLEEHPI
jgi:thioredoxin reductase (NADPH)